MTLQANPSRTCTADKYCIISRTKLVPSGKGYDLICPICNTEYTVTPQPAQTTPEQQQKAIDRIYGVTAVNRDRESGEGGKRYKALRRRAGYKTLVELPHEIIALDYLSSIDATLACTTGGAYVIRKDGSYYPLGVEGEPLSAEVGLIENKSYGEYQERKNKQMSKALKLMDAAPRTLKWRRYGTIDATTINDGAKRVGAMLSECTTAGCDQINNIEPCDESNCPLRAATINLSKQRKQAKDPHFTPIIDRPDNIGQNRTAERAVGQLSDNHTCSGVG